MTKSAPPAYRSLRASEIRYRRLFEAARDGILMLDAASGEITAVNPFLADLLGYSQPEILGKKLWELSPFEDITKSKITFKELQNHECLRYDDLPLETRDGRAIAVEFVSTMYVSGAEHVIQCNMRDITARKQSERAQQTSDECYRTLFEYAPDGILIADLKSRYIDANASICRMLGYSREQLIGLYASDIVVAAEVRHIGPALASITGASDYHREWQFRRKDGSVFSADVIATAMPDGNRLAMIRDVTARRMLEAQFQQAQKMDAVGRLAGGVAHDFNNLLTVILGFCELLLADADRDHPHRLGIAEIQKAGTRAAGLTRQLLAFSRKEIIEPTLIDLNAILADMQPMLGRLLREDIKIVFRARPGLARVKADRGQMEQVLLNLAVNAQDSMAGGGTLTIETANVDLDEHYGAMHFDVKPGPYVVLTVTDSGMGMTSNVLEHLFEPFFTTKEAGKGTGLGLATVHGIVTRSGGSVNVYSEVGRGSSFKVYFPRAAAASTGVSAPAAAPQSWSGSEKVLVVEDAEGLRELTKRLLERQGYGVVVAANAEEAIRLFDEDPSIDVLLTDVVMAGPSGPELTKQLVERRPELKVIYMSGYTDEAIVQHGVLNAGIAFLHKPFTSDALGRKIRDVLDT